MGLCNSGHEEQKCARGRHSIPAFVHVEYEIPKCAYARRASVTKPSTDNMCLSVYFFILDTPLVWGQLRSIEWIHSRNDLIHKCWEWNQTMLRIKSYSEWFYNLEEWIHSKYFIPVNYFHDEILTGGIYAIQTFKKNQVFANLLRSWTKT